MPERDYRAPGFPSPSPPDSGGEGWGEGGVLCGESYIFIENEKEIA